MATKSALSNVDIIRRFVYGHQPVSIEEISAELRNQMSSIRTDELARKNTELVLTKNDYFRQVDGNWEIDFAKMPEYQVLHGVMRETHQLLYERDVRTKVAQKLGVKVGQVVLDLFRAEGMKRFGPSRWGLDNWVLSNDAAAEVLKKHTGGLSEKDLTKHVADATGVAPELIVFQFVGDKRFVAERKLWLLKEFADKKKAAPTPKAAGAKRKSISVDEGLESGFLQAQVAKAEGGEDDSGERLIKSRLRKANIKVAQEIVEAREDLQPKPEDFAARLSQVLSNAGVDDYGVRSFQRVESAPKERGLQPKERDEINQFISQLLEQETVGVGASVQSIANAPLSARKMQDVLRLKYINYTRDRAVIPQELNKFLVELLRPNINTSTINPSSMEGLLAVELFTYLYDHLEDGAWALTEDGATLEIVQRDGQRYMLTAKDAQLAEQARDRFIVSQVDLVNHYLNNRFTGIEADKVLARAARVVTRLSGFENAYVVSRDYLSELPEVFGYQHDEENLIPDTFDMVIGNFTFTQDPNMAAGYLDTSLKVLGPGGRLGVFVLSDLLTLLKEHGLLGDFLRGMAVTHLLRLPLVEGRHRVVALLIEALPAGQTRSDREFAYADVEDLRGMNQLAVALRDGNAGDAFKLIDPNALGTLI